MDRPRSAHSSAYGLITIEDRGTEELRFQDGRRAGGVAVVAHHRYSWRPPLDMQWRFPDGFVIEVDCKVRPDGMRTFLPFGGYESFIHNAFVAGLEILTELRRLGPWGHHSYCGMKLIFGAVRDMREHFNRSFNFVRDLYIRLPGRESRNERNVLPSDLGTTADGRRRKWSIRQLLECGREAARASGITRPATRQCIIYGLLAAARLNPLRITGKNLQLLVRMALYDLPSGKRPPRKLVNQVSERIWSRCSSIWVIVPLSSTNGSPDRTITSSRRSRISQTARGEHFHARTYVESSSTAGLRLITMLPVAWRRSRSGSRSHSRRSSVERNSASLNAFSCGKPILAACR